MNVRSVLVASACVAVVAVVTVGAAPPAPAAASTSTINIVGPLGSGRFGTSAAVLRNGNYVVTDPSYDSATALDVGAVYLYDGLTNQRISMLTGSTANDQIGISGLEQVGDHNVLVRSPLWDGAAADVGAISWIDGDTGLNGVISAANSVVGSTANDVVGAGPVEVLKTGNWVAANYAWTNGGNAAAGAATFGLGNAATIGPVGPANSLVGTAAFDGSAIAVTELENGNYVVRNSLWNNGLTADAGAATFGSGTTGVVGAISPAKSLVGTTAADQVGSGVVALANGAYVVRSNIWNNGPALRAGAATWAPTTGISGAVTTTNSLVGSTTDDFVGSTVKALSNGNYVVASPSWTGLAVNTGAVTWASGATGRSGTISAANSLVGSTLSDAVGSIVDVLTNGNYVVGSPDWDGAAIDGGAVTWGNGVAGTIGAVDLARSYYGTHTTDRVGLGVSPLENGNYVIMSPLWSNGVIVDLGAATWARGDMASSGAVSASNSLVGAVNQDFDSASVRPLENGNYLVYAPNADIAAVPQAGALTWGSGTTGIVGAITTTNSMVGSTPSQFVGNVTPLSNGNYVVASAGWDNGGVLDVGAVRLGNGLTGSTGPLTPANSFIGNFADDHVGTFVTPVEDGNFVVSSRDVDLGGIANVGAVTWFSGTGPVAGTVTASNSLVGTKANDQIGADSSIAIETGGYVVRSSTYDNGAVANAGAFTYLDGPPFAGTVTPNNSAIGQTMNGGAQMSTRAQTTLIGAVLVQRPQDNAITLIVPTPKPNFVSLPPARLVDTRPGASTVDGVDAGGGLRDTGTTMEITVAGRGGVAPNAIAASLNVTAVDGGGNGFATVFPCGDPRPTASSLNYTVGATVPNAVLTKLGAGGKVCVFVSQPTHLVVDVTGYFPTTSTFVPANPARVLETRPGEVTVDGQQQGGGAAAGGSVTEVQIAGRAGVPESASSAALNVTATDPVAPGHLTIFPCGETRPTASNLNYVGGATVANLVISKLGAGGKVCVFASVATHLIVDVTGYFPRFTTYTALTPARLLESRPGLTTTDGAFNNIGLQPGGSVTELQVTGRGGVPPTAETVVLNATITEPGGPGFATIFPCGITPPLASNLNFVGQQTVANAVVVKVGTAGKVCIFNSQPTHIVIDVSGYFPVTVP